MGGDGLSFAAGLQNWLANRAKGLVADVADLPLRSELALVVTGALKKALPSTIEGWPSSVRRAPMSLRSMNQKAGLPTNPDSTRPIGRSGLAALGLAALGIVFGDIGTSPLYTLKTVLSMTRGTPTPDVVLGVLSLIVWTLIIITSVKYVVVAMSIDNDGEGGILALMSLLCIKKHQQPIIVAIGLFGAA